MDSTYNHAFYKNRHKRTSHSANTVLSIVLDLLPDTRSAVDFGCGVGTWLSVLKDKGIEEVLGVDGPWVDYGLLEIPKDSFRQLDIGDTMGIIEVDQKYDLAISLEVAEHLPPEAAESFVNSLARASDFILFSAAIPFQGGRHHVNEQWPEYWASLFEKRGYVVLDCIRGKIWSDQNIPTWYRQNTLMYIKQERISDLKSHDKQKFTPFSSLALVHPNSYIAKIQKLSSLKKQASSLKGVSEMFLQIFRKRRGKYWRNLKGKIAKSRNA